MIPIPLTTVIYDRGPGGTFTRQNPQSLAGRLTSYEDAIEARGGFKSLRVSFPSSAAEAKEYLDAGLLREIRSFTPRGKLRWEGVLVELKVTIGPVTIVRALEDMANVLVVSYGSDAGGSGTTTTYSNLTSIAEYGTKMLQCDLSVTTATGAANWAQTELVRAAWPQRSREINLDTNTGGSITIELRAVGRYDLLDWLLTSITSKTVTQTSTQLVSLLSSYNAVNNWFSTATADIIATGASDTEFVEPNTSYKEKIETLLSQGNASHQALAWGVYGDGAFVVTVWAGAAPSTVTYYRDARDRTVRDASGNIVDPWDLAPDAMVEDVALLGMAEDASAIATETREYVARVGLSIGSSGIRVTMEPDTLSVTSPAAVADAVQHPAGKGSIDRSSRASKVGREIKKKTRTIHPSTDNPNTPTITGGGSIDTGGGTITYPPGGGSTTGVTGTGTTGAITKWSNGATGVLTDAVAGTDYVAPSTLSETIDDRVAALLIAGSNITLTYNDAANTLTIAATASGPSGSGTTGRVAEWASSGTLQASTLAKSGTGVLTLSASGTATLTVSSSGTLNMGSGTLTLGPDLTTSGAGATITLSAAGAYTLTIPATGTAALLGTAQTFTAAQTINSTLTVGTTGSSSLGSPRLYVRGNSTSSGSYAFVVDNSGSTAVFTVQNNGTIGTSGDYRINGNLIIADQRTGWTIPTGTASRAGYDTSTATLTQVAQTLYALIYDLKNWHGLIA